MKTITIQDSTWEKLSILKIKSGYNSMDEMIYDIIFRKNIKEDKQHGNT